MTRTEPLRIDRALSKQLESLAGADATRTEEERRALFARTVWSRLVEPGDVAAGSLIERLGTITALAAIIEAETAHAFVRTVAQEWPDAAFDRALTTRLARGYRRWLPRLSERDSREDLTRGIDAGLHVVTPAMTEWPRQLDDLGPHAPLLLWTKGDTSVLRETMLAVVGARACTAYGSHVTAELTDAACRTGATIVSGAAYGVDAVAHRTALAREAPTIAVLAGGADRPYPRAHTSLLERIGANGVVCSEMIPGAAPTRWRFLQRNRCIAALSRAVLVTEAGTRSGSLNTAGHAAELSRSIGAVPGPITSAASAGCHRLVREYGATLVTGADDVRELLGIDELSALFGDSAVTGDSTVTGDAATADERQLSVHRRVLDALPLRGGRGAEAVAREAGLEIREVRTVLSELELLEFVAKTHRDGATAPEWRLLKRQ